MRLLTQFKDQKQMLLDDPNLVPYGAGSFASGLAGHVYAPHRLAEAEFSGQQIMPGEKVVMYYGAANRDPEVFQNPDQMDMHRNNVQDHLAFGTGPHVCLGQRIANMQLETAYKRILDRFRILNGPASSVTRRIISSTPSRI